VVASAAVFGSAGGWFALLLCDVFAVAYYLPHDGLAISRSADVLGFLIFNLIAGGAVLLIAALQAALEETRRLASDLARASEAREQAERAKDLLLKEAGHRIKNNLMTLIGVISVQQRALSDEAARAAL